MFPLNAMCRFVRLHRCVSTVFLFPFLLLTTWMPRTACIWGMLQSAACGRSECSMPWNSTICLITGLCRTRLIATCPRCMRYRACRWICVRAASLSLYTGVVAWLGTFCLPVIRTVPLIVLFERISWCCTYYYTNNRNLNTFQTSDKSDQIPLSRI